MEQDAQRMRGDRPFVFISLLAGQGADAVIAQLKALVGLD